MATPDVNVNTDQVSELEQAKIDKAIKKDRLRFTKNKLPANLAILAILINAFYFVSIYKSNSVFYYKPLVGVSIVVNLLFMLAGFLCSEGIKNYRTMYGYILIGLAVVQVIRIFIYPMQAHSTEVEVSEGVTKLVMENAQFARVLIYLISSSAVLFAAGIIGIIKSKQLLNYRKEIGDEKPS